MGSGSVRLAVTFPCDALLAGCAVIPWPHWVHRTPRVAGTLRDGAAPVAGRAILVAADSRETPCIGETIVSRTDDEGAFSFEPQKHFGWFLVVMAHCSYEWSICFEDQGQWVPIFESRDYTLCDFGPQWELELDCNLKTNEQAICDTWHSWLDRPDRDPPETLAGNASQLDEDVDFCGPGRPVPAFEIEHEGHVYTLPSSGRIDRDGERIYEAPEDHPWVVPYDGVLHAPFGPYLLVQVYWQDCVDLYDSRLFVIDPEGIVLEQQVWTAHWRNGFLVDRGELVYWSEWFCNENNEDRLGGQSYVMVFSEADASFLRRAVDDAVYCARRDELHLIEFSRARELEGGEDERKEEADA